MDTDRTVSPTAPRLCLAAWRRAFALSQQALASYAGLDRKTVMRAEERGQARPASIE